MRYLLASLSFYFLSMASYSEAINFAPWSIYSVYTLVILLFIFVLILYGIIKDSKDQNVLNDNGFKLKHWCLLCIVLLLWYLIRFQVFTNDIIWFDEATQYVPYWIMHQGSLDSVKFAAIQQQMPLDYYTSYVFLKIFGLSAEAMLFHSRVYGLLSVGVLFIILQQMKLNWFVVIIGMTVFLSESTILRHSSEARPIGLMILLGLINFYYFNKYINAKNHRTASALLPSTLLFLLSTGLQPVIHVFTLTVLFILKSQVRVKIKYLIYNLFICFSLILPLLWNLYSSTAGAYPSFKSQDLVSFIFDLFSNYNINLIFIFLNQHNHILINSILTLLILFYFSKSNYLHNLKHSKNIVYIVLFPLLFIWSWSVMDWEVSRHYFVIWTVISILLLSQMLNELVSFCIKHFNKAALGIMAVVFSILLYQYVLKQKIELAESKSLPDIRGFFQHENKNSNSLYLVFPFRHPGDSGFFFQFLGSFYNSKNRYFWIEETKSLFNGDLYGIRPDLKSIFNRFEEFPFYNQFDLFVLVYCGKKLDNPICDIKPSDLAIGSTEPEIRKLDATNISFIYRNQIDVIGTFDRLFNVFEDKIGHSIWMYEFYRSKLGYLMEIKNYSLAKKYIIILENILQDSEFSNFFDKEHLLKELNTMKSMIN